MSLPPALFCAFHAFRPPLRGILQDLPVHAPAPAPKAPAPAPAAKPVAAPPAMPPTRPPADSPAAAANPFGGTLRPGLPALGITEHTVNPGDTLWRYLDEGGVFDEFGRGNADRLLDSYLPGTPALDTRAFGTRPAQPADAARDLRPGQRVTVLDVKRLGYLEQQRSELAALEGAGTPRSDSQVTHREALRTDLVTSVYQELDYAGTQQAVPDVQALAAPILARAPADPTFSSAVDDAASLYRQSLQAQGRTADQLGVIAHHAQQQDFDAVRSDTRQQLLDLCGDASGNDALGRISARAGVVMSFDGGDPRFAQAVQQGIRDAEHSVLIDRPVQAVDAAYRQHGAAAAMKLLNELTDPQTATPGQVGQILADPRTQAVVKHTIDDVTHWTDARGGPGALLQDLAAACQHAAYSDGGTPGLGKQAVDAVAQEIVDAAGRPLDGPGDPFFLYGGRTRDVMSDAASQGNVALGLAIASKAHAQGNPGLGDAALDGTRNGLRRLAGDVKDLNEKTAEDAAFLSVPAQEWGGASTSAEQSANVKALIAANPGLAKTLAQDGEDLAALQERLESVRTSVAAWTPSLKGTEGFDRAVHLNARDGLVWSGPDDRGVTALTAGIPAPAMEGTAPAGTPTNTLWFQRSLRKVLEMVGTGTIAKLDQGGRPLLSPSAKAVVQNLWKRGNKTLGALLYFQNAAYELGEFGEKARSGALVNGLVNGASGVRQELAGVSYALSAGIPRDQLAALRPGSGGTPLARAYANGAAGIDGLAVSDGSKLAMKQGLRLVLQDTSDLASAVLGVVSAVNAFREGQPLEGVGQSLNAVGYGMMLTGSGIDEAVFAADATLAGMGATAWTGIGAALVLAGSAIYTGATAHSHSHQFDGASRQWLQAMGVKKDIADVLARHATSFDGAPPSAGPFLTAYAAHAGLGQRKLVDWLNSLSPKQADDMASAVKTFGDEWKHHAIAADARRFDDALLQYGLMPPDVQLAASP